MSSRMALNVIMSGGFLAKPYHNGVPDIAARNAGVKRVKQRDIIKRKLNSMVIPKVDPLDTYSMQEVIRELDRLFKASDFDGEGFNFVINPFVDPGGAAIAPTPGAGGGTTGPDGGVTIDPVTGLPLPAAGGAGAGAPAIDPVTGLPLPAAGGVGAGLPGAGLPEPWVL